jgi:hydroxymethylbilane synthase
MNVIIGSRGSDLALWQANYVKSLLHTHGIGSEIRIIKTQGDQIQHLGFDKMEGKGFFTKEIEDALLAGQIDVAVHSHKDLPTTSPEGLIIAAVSEREDPSELLLVNKEAVDSTRSFSLRYKAVVGSSSARRKSQLLSFRKDLIIQDLRGNVPTRVQKLREKKYDAIMLAAAGVDRLQLDLSDLYVERLSPVEFIPAPAQGVLAIQIREKDTALMQALQKIHNPEVAEEIAIERKVLNLFDGGCQLPLGVYCRREGSSLMIWTSKSKGWNTIPVRIMEKVSLSEPVKTDEIARKIVSKVTGIKPCTVFITRDLGEDSYFRNALTEHGFRVEGQSLISTSPVRFSSVPPTDWIFFSSRNAVEYFFAQDPRIAEGTKFGVIGKGTEAALRSLGKIPSFVGRETNTYDTGTRFASVVGNGSVLFPQAKDSLQTIQKQLSFTSKVYDLYVYRTSIKENFSLPDAQIIVFTSPSNVTSFYNQTKIMPHQKTIAIGPATARELERYGIRNYTVPHSFDEVGLAEAVFSTN